MFFLILVVFTIRLYALGIMFSKVTATRDEKVILNVMSFCGYPLIDSVNIHTLLVDTEPVRMLHPISVNDYHRDRVCKPACGAFMLRTCKDAHILLRCF